MIQRTNALWYVIIGCSVATGLLLAACGSGNGSARSAASAPAQAVATTASTAAAPTVAERGQTPAVNPVARVSGSVTRVSDNDVVMSDGSDFRIDPSTAITKRLSGAGRDIQAGRVVAVTAKREPDNTLLASMVLIFPIAPNFQLGQRPIDGGNLMTNATVDKADGETFTVSFPGGGAQVRLAPGAQVQILAPGTAADIKPGLTISAAVRNGVAQSVAIQ
jgi:hypothetical protein